MTGYASGQGADGPWRWTWEMRSVNARGLDLRLRLPDGLPGLEEALRKALTARFARGAVQVGLRLSRDGGAGGSLNRDALDAQITLLGQVAARARAAGLALAPMKASDLVGLRGVLDVSDAASADLAPTLLADMIAGIDALAEARSTEGAALAPVIAGQVDNIADLVDRARGAIPDAHAAMLARLRAQIDAAVKAAGGLSPDRMAQEMALIASKADVTEELDRLDAHIAAARDLMAGVAPMGRKFDFLSQEFMREANTFCSKSADPTLTRIGLDLKAAIEQMREQIQNVE